MSPVPVVGIRSLLSLESPFSELCPRPVSGLGSGSASGTGCSESKWSSPICSMCVSDAISISIRLKRSCSSSICLKISCRSLSRLSSAISVVTFSTRSDFSISRRAFTWLWKRISFSALTGSDLMSSGAIVKSRSSVGGGGGVAAP